MRARRVLVSAPVLLALALGGAPALAADDPGLFSGTRLEHRSERAAKGARLQKAGTAEEGVVRRSARLTDVDHDTGATPSQRLVSVDVVVDLQAQTMSATATLGGAPDPAAPLVVVVGTWDGRTCVPVFGVQAQGGGAVSQFVGEATGPAAVTVSGTQVTVTAGADPRLRSTAFECAYSQVVDPADARYALSVAYADDLVETWTPVLEVEPDQKVVGARKGRWARLDVEVRNISQGDATGVRLTASGKGIEVKQGALDIGLVENRSTEYLDLDVRLLHPRKKGRKNRTPKPRTLTLTVTDPAAATVTTTTTVVVTPKPTTPRKLTGTYWWGWEATNLQSSAGWINHAIWFVDTRWAFTGWAEGRKPRCSANVKG